MTATGFVLGLISIITFHITQLFAKDFTYGGQHGPEHWGEEYNRCSGKHQSPINIDDLNVVERVFPLMLFDHFTTLPNTTTIVNNGHTILVRMTYNKKEPTVTYGPLGSSRYRFTQLHFHWGENDTVGSEDLINNASFPAELHLVMTNVKYPDFETAITKKDGLTVLAFFFKIVPEDNENYVEFTDLLKDVQKQGTSVEFKKQRSLWKYMVDEDFKVWSYYTYIGSLTTPPCNEDVIWIDFTEPIPISERQINRFRDLTGEEQPLMNNFRPTQPINDRTVYKAIMPTFTQPPFLGIPFINAENAGTRVLNTKLVLIWLSSIFMLAKLKA